MFKKLILMNHQSFLKWFSTLWFKTIRSWLETSPGSSSYLKKIINPKKSFKVNSKKLVDLRSCWFWSKRTRTRWGFVVIEFISIPENWLARDNSTILSRWRWKTELETISLVNRPNLVLKRWLRRLSWKLLWRSRRRRCKCPSSSSLPLRRRVPEMKQKRDR